MEDDPKVIQAFDPNIAELTAMVEQTKDLTATDLEDKAQLEVVRTARISLKNARVKIEKAGKAARDEANKYSKAVIAYEDKLIDVIAPEEARLKAIEEEAEKLAIRKEREEKLPARKERIATAGLSFFHTKTDDEMLELDANGFEAYFNELGATKVSYDKDQADIAAQEAEQKRRDELAAEEQRINDAKAKAEQEDADRKAALKAEEDRIANERQQLDHDKEVEAAKKETEARVKKEEEDRKAEALADAKANEIRIAEEKKKTDAALAAKKKYQDFLKSVGMTKANVAEFHKEETETEIVIYKKVGSYKK